MFPLNASRRARSVVVLLVSAMLFVACASDGPSTAEGLVESTTTTPSSGEADATDSSETDADGETETDDSTTTENASTDSTAAPEDTSTTTAAESADLPFVDACETQRNPAVGSQSATLVSGGNEYELLWTVPSGYDRSPTPLVLNFHGLGSNGGQQNVFSGFGALAEAEGFVVVHPTGLQDSADARVSWELPQFDVPERDDIAFVTDLLDFMAGEVCVDQERIFSTGMSNGSFLTSVIVCELSDRFAGAASVAGVTHPDGCDPEEPVPYLAFHGTADTTVPYAGGGESTLSEADGQPSEFFEQVMPDEFAEFADDFGCGEFTDTEVTDEISLRSWSGCDEDVELGFYTIDGGGHTWPGSPISEAIPSLGFTNVDIDATQLAWEFFQRQ